MDIRFEAEEMPAADMFLGMGLLPDQSGVNSGIASGMFELTRDGPASAFSTGRGNFVLRDSRFISSALFSRIGGVLNLERVFRDITFTKIEGDFRLAEGRIILDPASPVHFSHQLGVIYPFDMEAVGYIGPERKLDAVLKLNFLPIASTIPILEIIWPSGFLRFRIEGIVGDPRVSLTTKSAP
jgi:hypothetical protein